MEAAHLSLDGTVDVREEGGRIVIEPIRPKKYDLARLLAGITAENLHAEVDFRPTAGQGSPLMFRRYVPEAGDLVWLHFDPQAGHEQAGHRPALVVSPAAYNGKTGLMLCCPMTTQIKGYPFEVPIAGDRPGAALADQVKSLDWGGASGAVQRKGFSRRIE
jgi:mRNA interferase MazF